MRDPAWQGDKTSFALRLLEVVAWVTNAPDPEDVLRRAVQGLYEVPEADSAVAYAYHAREGLWSSGPASALPPRVRPYAPIRNHGVTCGLVQALAPLAVPDCTADPTVKPELVVGGVRAFVGLPLLRERSVRAVVYVNFGRPREFDPELLALLGAFARQTSAALDRAEAHRALRVVRDRMILSLAEAVDARGHPTGSHSRKTRTIARGVGQVLGLSPNQMESLEVAALLHDIGKIGVRDAILLKPGPLSPEERLEVEQHSLIGARILAAAGLPEVVVEAVRHAHEKFDGTGYPAGLAGEHIPLLSRIVAVADAFEAMTSHRPYRRGTDWDRALEELERQAARQFDPRVVGALRQLLSDPAKRQGLATELNAVSFPGWTPPQSYRAQLREMLDHVQRVCGDRICHNLVRETARSLPHELHETCIFLLQGVLVPPGTL